jgi:hypothetical protein
VFLPNYVLVQILFYLLGLGHVFKTGAYCAAGLFAVLPDDVVAQLNTFRTNKDPVWTLYERISLASRSAAETANSLGFSVIYLLGHYYLPVLKLHLAFRLHLF